MSRISDGRLDDVLARVVRQLPDHATAIEAECAGSQEFRGLCEEYAVCADALLRWQASDAPEAAARRDEYGQWLVELEAEIVEWLRGGASGARTGTVDKT